PRRQTSAERSAAGDVWINVRADLQSLPARCFDAAQHLRHAPPVLLIRSFEVPDFGGNVGAARDLENFLHRIIDGVGFAALMRDVDAAVLMSDFGQLDNLIS